MIGNKNFLSKLKKEKAMRALTGGIIDQDGSSSELFGSSPSPQNEETKMCPQSPHAAAKLYSYWMVKNYRDAYGMFASNGILFNHESPRRGETFVTRKITRSIANMMAQNQDKLYLGNLDALKDWGFAPEYNPIGTNMGLYLFSYYVFLSYFMLLKNIWSN